MSLDKHHSTHNDIKLTAGEIATLWSQYQSDTMAICVLKHFLSKVEDSDLYPVLQYALDRSQHHVKVISEIFDADKFPLPVGFTDDDVNINAPPLFSDIFVAMYIRHMAILGMAAGTVAVGMCARADASRLFMEIVAETVELHNKARQLLLEKGVYVRTPFLSTPDKVEFVSKQSFLTGFFGEKRPLTAMEITHLFFNVLNNALGKAMVMAFAQAATSRDVEDFMLRGKEVCEKHIDLFGDVLMQDDLPSPMTWDAHVTDSTIAPFSDKLMLFHINVMAAAGISNYAAAAAASQRRDIGFLYARLLPEIVLYAEDGLKLMIDNHWLEEPPLATNRDALTHKS